MTPEEREERVKKLRGQMFDEVGVEWSNGLTEVRWKEGALWLLGRLVDLEAKVERLEKGGCPIERRY